MAQQPVDREDAQRDLRVTSRRVIERRPPANQKDWQDVPRPGDIKPVSAERQDGLVNTPVGEVRWCRFSIKREIHFWGSM